MIAVNLSQPATLSRINGMEIGNGRRRMSGVAITEGPLKDMLAAYYQQRESERGRLRLTIAGGFHLDGHEIEDLILETSTS